MLDDRDYMRETGRSEPLPWSVKLLITLVVCYALQCINDVYLKTNADMWLGMSPATLRLGMVWQLFTFQFLHNNLWHLLMNGLGLWFFGRAVEFALGRKRFLAIYLLSGLAGGLLQAILMALFPMQFGRFVFGASAGISGLFAAYAWMQTDAEVRWNFILAIPARLLFWISVGIEAFFTLVPTSREVCVAHAAHLGGLLMGMKFVQLGWHHDYVNLPWEKWFQRRAKPARQPTASPLAFNPEAGANTPSSADFISQEVDPILDKISAHGIHSLTDRERKVLEKARAAMAKRN